MARIRSIKPEFWSSEQVADLSPLARLAFIGLWTFCDDAGRHSASPRRLKMEVMPADDVTSEAVAGLVQEMIEAGLVFEYEVEGERFWQVTGWNRHQKIDKPTLRHPAPQFDESSASSRRALGDHSTSSRRVLDESSTSPRLRNGMEWIGVEGNGPSSLSPSVREGQPEAAVAAQGEAGLTPYAEPARLRPPDVPPPRTDADLRPIFDAYREGAASPGLVWNIGKVLPTERIAAVTRDPARVRAGAELYAKTCRDGDRSLAPSFARFSAEADRWIGEASARTPTARAAPTRDEMRARGVCPDHPGIKLDEAGECDLCRDVAAVMARARA